MSHMRSCGDTMTEVLPLQLPALCLFRYSRDYYPGPTEPVLELQKKPRSYSIETTSDNEGAHSPNTTPSASLAVSEYLSNPLLAFLLKDLTELTSFSYSAYAPHSFNFQSCIRALEPLSNSLRGLKLKLFVGEPRHGASKPETTRGGSLSNWPRLEYLDCPLMVLLGKGRSGDTPRLADVLPSSLRLLVVRQDRFWLYEEVVGQVVELLRQKEAKVPNLNGLLVAGSKGVDERLAVACAAVSVRYLGDRMVR